RQSGREARRTPGRRGVQSFRAAGDARQSLWPHRPGDAPADGAHCEIETGEGRMNQVANVQSAKGPLVWLDMDQKALDDAYDQAVYAPNRDQVHKRNVFNSERVRQRLGAPKRMAYGSKEMEQLDLFATSKPNAPISVFIHGGAWRTRTVKDYHFL